MVNRCSPTPVGIVDRGHVGLDETVPAVGDPFGFGEDFVVDDRVEFLVGLVGDRKFVLPTVGAGLFHLIVTQHPLLDFIAGLRLATDVRVVVLDAQPEVDPHDLGWRGLRLLGVRGHEAISCASTRGLPSILLRPSGFRRRHRDRRRYCEAIGQRVGHLMAVLEDPSAEYSSSRIFGG
jgi:hypothetical protein